MPSAPTWLCDLFPGDDEEALKVLERNFVVPRGFIIHPKVAGYKPTQRENEAIDYMFMEWDYGYTPEVPSE